VERAPDDHHEELPISTFAPVRWAWLAVGFTCLGLGFIGAFLPVMPTTVFILIAAYAFARSSPRFYAFLLRHRTFGPLIRNWRAGRGITARAKTTAVTMILLTIGSSAIFFVSTLWVRILLVVIAVSVITFLLTRPTAPPEAQAS
jgi:uncharacterized protein